MFSEATYILSMLAYYALVNTSPLVSVLLPKEKTPRIPMTDSLLWYKIIITDLRQRLELVWVSALLMTSFLYLEVLGHQETAFDPSKS